MAVISDHDLRQLERMDERLRMFEEGGVSLRVLIADLEFLSGALEARDASVGEALRERWGLLEEVYSATVVTYDGTVDPDGEALVRETVRALREQVRQLLASAPG
jgi:hypothetical protein